MAATLTIQPMFAEVSDKMPTVGGLWLLGLIAAALVFAMYLLSRYTLLLSLPLAALWLVGVFHEFYGDAYFKPAVISEMGWSYLHVVVFTADLPLFAAGVCGVLFLRSPRSFAAN